MFKINLNLIGYKEYFDRLNLLLEKNLLPNAVIISGDEGIGKSTFLVHFFIFQNLNSFEKIKYLDTFSFDNYNLINKLLNSYYSNIKIIKKEGNSQYINIDQIRELEKFCSLQSFNNKKRFVYISNIEDLNMNALTALLKTLEKPQNNIFFFLEKNSQNHILETISSRCLKFNIFFKHSILNNITEKVLKDYDISFVNNGLLFNKFDTPGSKLNKFFYLSDNQIMNMSLKNIILFCLTDYNKTKNYLCIKLALEFCANLFFNYSLNNRYFSKNYYSELINKIQISIRYNLDMNSAIRLVQEL